MFIHDLFCPVNGGGFLWAGTSIDIDIHALDVLGYRNRQWVYMCLRVLTYGSLAWLNMQVRHTLTPCPHSLPQSSPALAYSRGAQMNPAT